MGELFHLLVAERNSNIRDFLCRELSAEGYRVMSAKDGGEVKKLVFGDERLDLIILDHDLPLGGVELLDDISKRSPPAPVILHSLLRKRECEAAVLDRVSAYLEKTGDNLDLVKQTVELTLGDHFPERFRSFLAKRPGAGSGDE